MPSGGLRSIPQRQGEPQVFVYRGTTAPYLSWIGDVAAQRDFYSKPTPDGTRTLDDEITSYENRLGPMLARMRESATGPISDSTVPAELVTHLCIRAAFFHLSDVPRPIPGKDKVLVRIHASGVNPLDTKIRAGAADHARHPLPAVLGIDLAGVVEAVGANVRRFRTGDELYGMTGGVAGVPGSLAQFAAVDSDLLAFKPARLTMREAAALPLVAITAWEGLVDRARVAPGMKVLVQGGAGGVGHVAVQIARALGAEVFASDRSGRALEIERAGATFVDTSLPAHELAARFTAGQGFDVVYDTVGGAVLDASFALIRRFGHVVSCLGWGTHALAPLSFKAGSYSGVFTLLPLLTGEGRAHHGEILARVAALVDAGRLAPRLDPRRFSFLEVEAAHLAVTGGSAAGKVVVDVE